MAPADDERRKPRLGVALAVIFGLLLMYVLSFGPAYRLHMHNRISIATLFKVYYPLYGIRERSDTANDVVDWYANQWASPRY